MNKQYTLPEDEAPKMAGEPAAAYKFMLHYSRPMTQAYFEGVSHEDIKWTINYLMSLLEVPEVKPEENRGGLADAISGEELKMRLHENLSQELKTRLVHAAQDAREGRTMSCEEVHESLEKKFPSHLLHSQ